jgi:hypothetical protein
LPFETEVLCHSLELHPRTQIPHIGGRKSKEPIYSDGACCQHECDRCPERIDPRVAAIRPQFTSQRYKSGSEHEKYCGQSGDAGAQSFPTFAGEIPTDRGLRMLKRHFRDALDRCVRLPSRPVEVREGVETDVWRRFFRHYQVTKSSTETPDQEPNLKNRAGFRVSS